MGIVFRIAFRNLIRQKRRNLLLGTGIALCVMLLFISQSYTKGLSDILINSFISNIFGHIQINVTEKTEKSIPIIRDKYEALKIINKTIGNVSCYSESVSALTRAVGNRSGALMLIVGVEKSNRDFLENLKVIDGDLKNFTDEKTETPVILYSPKAEELNVKAGDTVNIKMSTIYGQMQSARLNVAAVVEPKNIFLNMAGFTSLETIKNLLGYRPHETSRLNIILENVRDPEETVISADLLHKAFEPMPVIFKTSLLRGVNKTNGLAAGLRKIDNSRQIFKEEFSLPENAADTFHSGKPAVIIGKNLAERLGSKKGSLIRIRYYSKYDEINSPSTKFKVAGIINNDSKIYSETAFFNEPFFTSLFTSSLPLEYADPAFLREIELRKNLTSSIVFDKKLLKRPAGSKELREIQRFAEKYPKTGSLMSITSMRETAEDVLKIESALNIISFITIMILFTIILTGSANALRMTIRERTREIGTIRSIGMQKNQVIRIFIAESAFLALFSATIGILTAFLVIILLSGMSFDVDNLFSILLDRGRLHFLPEIKTALADIIIALSISVLTAWFPAGKAASMSVTKALRHYE